MKKVTAFILALLSLSACEWDSEFFDAVVNDDVIEYCPEDAWPGELRYIVIDNKSCYRYDKNLDYPEGSLICKNELDCCGLERKIARKYILAFNHNMCPSEFKCHIPETDIPGDVHYCFYSGKCLRGLHLSSDEKKCEDDTVYACGSYNNNCLEKKGVEKAECIDGVCNALVCDSQHHLVKTSPKTHACAVNSVDACPAHDEDGSIVYEQDGSIRLKSCSLLEGDASATCTEHGCRVESCENGYYLDQNETHCELNSFDHCGAWYRDCHINGMSTGNCQLIDGDYSCVATSCEDGFTPVNGECRPNNNENCGLDGSGTVVKCGADYVCDSLIATCVKKSSGCGEFTMCDDVCVNTQSSPSHCGGCNISCGTNSYCHKGTCICINNMKDCDFVIGCETDFQIRHLSSCKECAEGYYDINNNKLDGCELNLKSYGLAVDENGKLICDLHYKSCGEYEISLNNKFAKIPLCLWYYFDGNELSGDDACKKLCNSDSSFTLNDIHYIGKKCKPKASCWLDNHLTCNINGCFKNVNCY